MASADLNSKPSELVFHLPSAFEDDSDSEDEGKVRQVPTYHSESILTKFEKQIDSIEEEMAAANEDDIAVDYISPDESDHEDNDELFSADGSLGRGSKVDSTRGRIIMSAEERETLDIEDEELDHKASMLETKEFIHSLLDVQLEDDSLDEDSYEDAENAEDFEHHHLTRMKTRNWLPVSLQEVFPDGVVNKYSPLKQKVFARKKDCYAAASDDVWNLLKFEPEHSGSAIIIGQRALQRICANRYQYYALATMLAESLLPHMSEKEVDALATEATGLDPTHIDSVQNVPKNVYLVYPNDQTTRVQLFKNHIAMRWAAIPRYRYYCTGAFVSEDDFSRWLAFEVDVTNKLMQECAATLHQIDSQAALVTSGLSWRRLLCCCQQMDVRNSTTVNSISPESVYLSMVANINMINQSRDLSFINTYRTFHKEVSHIIWGAYIAAQSDGVKVNLSLSDLKRNGPHDEFTMIPYIWKKLTVSRNYENTINIEDEKVFSTRSKDGGIFSMLSMYWDIGPVYCCLVELNILSLNLSCSSDYWFTINRLFSMLFNYRYDDRGEHGIGFTRFERGFFVDVAERLFQWSLQSLVNYRKTFGRIPLRPLEKRVKKLKPKRVPVVLRSRATERKEIIEALPSVEPTVQTASQHRSVTNSEINERNLARSIKVKSRYEVYEDTETSKWIEEVEATKWSMDKIMESYMQARDAAGDFTPLATDANRDGGGIRECASLVRHCWYVFDMECDMKKEKSLRQFCEPILYKIYEARFAELLKIAEERASHQEAFDNNPFIPESGLRSPFQFTHLAQLIVEETYVERRLRQTYFPPELSFWSSVAINAYWDLVVKALRVYMEHQTHTAVMMLVPQLFADAVAEVNGPAVESKNFAITNISESVELVKELGRKTTRATFKNVTVRVDAGSKSLAVAKALVESASARSHLLRQITRKLTLTIRQETEPVTVLFKYNEMSFATSHLSDRLNEVLPPIRKEGPLLLYRKAVVLYKLIFVKRNMNPEVTRTTNLRKMFTPYVDIWIKSGYDRAMLACPDPIAAGAIKQPNWSVKPAETNRVIKVLHKLERACDEIPVNHSQLLRFSGINAKILLGRVQGLAHFLLEEMQAQEDATFESFKHRIAPLKGHPVWESLGTHRGRGFDVLNFPSAEYVSRLNQLLHCEHSCKIMLEEMARRNKVVHATYWSPLDIYYWCIERNFPLNVVKKIMSHTIDKHWLVTEYTEDDMANDGLSNEEIADVTDALFSLSHEHFPSLLFNPSYIAIERLNHKVFLGLSDGIAQAYEFALVIERVLWEPVENLVAISATLAETKASGYRETMIASPKPKARGSVRPSRSSMMPRGSMLGGDRKSLAAVSRANLSQKDLDALDLGLLEQLDPEQVRDTLDTYLFDDLRALLDSFVLKKADKHIIPHLCRFLHSKLSQCIEEHLLARTARKQHLTLAQIERALIAMEAVRDTFMDYGSSIESPLSVQGQHETQTILVGTDHIPISRQVVRVTRIINLLLAESTVLIKLYQIFPKPKSESKDAPASRRAAKRDEAAHEPTALGISKWELWMILNARFMQELPNNQQCIDAKKFIRGNPNPPRKDF